METRAFDTAKGAQSTTATDAIAKATADFDATSSRINTGFEQRKAHLNRAHINARKRVLDAITQQEADIKYSVQTGSLEAERVRDEKLTATAAAFEDFNRRVGESQNRFAELEVAAHNAFGGYGRFRKFLAPDREWPQPDLSGDENQLLDELNRLEKKSAMISANFADSFRHQFSASCRSGSGQFCCWVLRLLCPSCRRWASKIFP